MQVWHAILSQQIDFEAAELEHVSDAAKELLVGLLDRNPASRFTPKQALIHPWIKVISTDGSLLVINSRTLKVTALVDSKCGSGFSIT